MDISDCDIKSMYSSRNLGFAVIMNAYLYKFIPVLLYYLALSGTFILID